MILTTGMAAVVTGGGSGLGEASARGLAAKGLKVAIFDRNVDAGQAVAADIGGLFCNADVTDNDSMYAAFKAARAAYGQERVLVCCAGIAPGAKTVSKGEPHDAQLFRTALDVNLFGTFLASSLAAVGMSEAEPLNDDGERGVIINTASIAAFDGQMGQIAYAASKAGIVGMTLPMARDLSRSGVRVMAIAPGLFGTPMMKGLPQDVQDSLADKTPFPQRLGYPAEFASLVCTICENGMMNGEVVRLDGAIRLAAR